MYRHLRLAAIAAVLLFSVYSPLAAQSNGALPALPETYFPALKAILDTALQQSPKMIAKNAEVAISEQNRISARAGQLPSFSGYMNYYPWDRQVRADLKNEKDPVTGLPRNPNIPLNPKGATNVEKLSYTLSINQPIFHWGALKNGTRIANLQLKIAQGQTAEAYRLLAEEVRSQYLALIIKKAYLGRARASQKAAEDELALARSKLEKHVIADADMFSPTIAAEQARLAYDHNESDYEYALIAFGKLTGSAPLTDEQLPIDIPAVTPVGSVLESMASQFIGQSTLNTYALENAKRAIEVEELNYKIANTRLLPKFNAVAGVTQDQQSYSLNPGNRYQVQDKYAGVTVNWTLFDGFQARAAKATSLLRRRELQRAFEEQSTEVVAAIKKQMRELEFSARSLVIIEKLTGSAAIYLKVKEEDQERGIASATDVQAARLGYQDSQIAAFTARADYLMKVSDLVSAMQKDPLLANIPAQRR